MSAERRRTLIRTLTIVAWVVAWCYFIMANDGEVNRHLEWLMLLGLFTLKTATDIVISWTTRAQPSKERFQVVIERLEAIEELLSRPKSAAGPAQEPTGGPDAPTIPILRPVPIDPPTMQLRTVPPPGVVNVPYRAIGKARSSVVVQGVPVTATPRRRRTRRRSQATTFEPHRDDVDIERDIERDLKNFIAGVTFNQPRDSPDDDA